MMLLDYFGVFSWISRKKDKINKIWANFGVLRHDVGIPRNNVGPHQGLAYPRHDVAEWRFRPASGMPRRSKATPRRNTIHRMEIFVLCIVSFFVALRTCLLD